MSGVKIYLTSMAVGLLVLSLFSLASKAESEEVSCMSTFECGFTSYFFSRYSFSIHYFLVGLIFLFLDLELCVLMPCIGGSSSSSYSINFFVLFLFLLLWGLLKEWKEGKLDWVS